MLGTSTLRWSPMRSAKSTPAVHRHRRAWTTSSRTTTSCRRPSCSSSQCDGQPGTVVPSKSSNRNLNAALNADPHLQPVGSEEGTQFTTSAGIQYEERRLFATQVIGPHAAVGSGERRSRPTSQTVASRIEPVRDLGIFAQEEVLLADRRLLLTAGRSGRPEQRQRQTPRSSSSIPRSRPPTGSCSRSAGWRSSSSGAPTARPATGRSSAPSSSPTPPAPSAGSSAPTSATGPAIPPSSPSGRRSSRAGSTPRFANGRAELTLTRLPAQHPGSASWSRPWRRRSARSSGSSATAAGCGTGASRPRSHSSRSRAGT